MVVRGSHKLRYSFALTIRGYYGLFTDVHVEDACHDEMKCRYALGT